MRTATPHPSGHSGASHAVQASQPAPGIMLGRSLILEPAPPVEDVLGEPLRLARMPGYVLPKETVGSRVTMLLGQLGWTRPAEALRRLRRLQTTVATILASVSPPFASELAANGWLTRHRDLGRFRVTEVTHPYDLMDAFRLLLHLPDAMPLDAMKERRFLEVVLALVLRQYRTDMIRTSHPHFSFDAEAREFLIRGVRLEHDAKMVTDPNERLNMLQILHDSCYHGRNYYLFSLLSRERTVNDGRMFLMYCQVVRTLARLEWDGTMHEMPVLRRLPPRHEVLYLFRRDRSLKRRYLEDAEYMARVKALLATFQDRPVV